MPVCVTIDEVRDALRDAERPLGAVLTMGALHGGHLALVRRARAECKTVAATIYVNPTQFGDARDLDTYPRPMQDDLRVLRREGVDVVLVPSDAEIYPEGFASWVEPGRVAERLEGEHRPGHFRGVCTVVLKLFNILGPDVSYFGQKDAQQLLVIRKMAADLALPVDIVAVPTVRERDGLAMSSRNGNLGNDERRAARVLHRALTRASDLAADGVHDADAHRHAVHATLAEEPLAQVDYVSIAHPETLEELHTLDGPALASLAVRIGQTRLIDNVTLLA
ncbi:MAG: pantoate--beta-alanine ligase [Chloroflexota bacterium]|nr:pantoate--beta-alanine ligase [Chloroflexota bacterium]